MRFSKQSRVDAWVAAAVILAVAAFLILCIPLLHMHPDEELSYRATNGGLTDTLRWQIDLEDNQAPLWFLGLNIWRRLVGDAEYTSRVLGVMFVLPALALVYRMARKAFGRQAAAFAILALIGNGLFFQYALDIRMYPLVMLVSTMSTFLLWRWLLRRTLWAAVLYGVSIALMLYTHYLLVFLVVVHALYVFDDLTSYGPPPFHRVRNRFYIVLQGLAAGSVAILLFLPWLPTAVTQVNHLREVEADSGTARGGVGIGVSTLPTTTENIGDLIRFATNDLGGIYFGVLVVGFFAVSGWSSRRVSPDPEEKHPLVAREQFNRWISVSRLGGRTMLLAILWAVAVPIVYLLINTRAGVYAPRYVSYLTLGLGLAVGGVLGLLPIPRWLRWIPLFALIALNLNHFGATLPVRIPFRDLFGQVSAEAQPGDVILLARAGEDNGFTQWQLDHYLPPDISRTTDLTLANAARRVWLLTADWFNDEVRAAFNTLEPSHPVQEVFGSCTNDWCYLAQLMEAPPLAEAIRFGDALEFRGADVTREDDGVISTRLWWTLDESLPVNFSFSLRLMDNSGALLAQADGAINHYGQEVVETSAMQVGRIYIDYRSLQVNPPNGTYTLALLVYDSISGGRLNLEDGSDSLILTTLQY